MFTRKLQPLSSLRAILDAGEVARAGEMACLDLATGNFKAGAPALPTLRRFGTFVENLIGDGVKTTLARLPYEIRAEEWQNDSGSPIVMPTNRGAVVYVKDAHTVTLDPGVGNAIAGVALEIDEFGRVVVAPPFELGGAGVFGTGGAAWDFVFGPSLTADPSRGVYSSWPALIAALGALPDGATPRVDIVESFTVPTAGMPATGWFMNNADLVSRTFDTGIVVLTLADGAKLDSIAGWERGIVLAFSPSVVTDTINWHTFALRHPGEPWILFIGKGAGYTSAGAVAPITGPGTGQFIVIAASEATLRAGPPPAQALVDITGSDIVIESQQFSGYFGSLPDGWLIGNGNLVRQLGIDTVIAAIPGFTGATLLTAIAKTDATRVLYTPTTLADWSGVAPTSVADALDRIAAKITPIP